MQPSLVELLVCPGCREGAHLELPWDREWMKGSWILYGGCGAGRLTEPAARAGA